MISEALARDLVHNTYAPILEMVDVGELIKSSVSRAAAPSHFQCEVRVKFRLRNQ